MRRLLAILLLCVATRASAAIAFVNSTVGYNFTGGTTITCTAANHATGNLVVVGVHTLTSTDAVSTVTDTAGNSYQRAGTKVSSAAGGSGEIWYATNVTGNASNVVTVTFGASAPNSIYALV